MGQLTATAEVPQGAIAPIPAQWFNPQLISSMLTALAVAWVVSKGVGIGIRALRAKFPATFARWTWDEKVEAGADLVEDFTQGFAHYAGVDLDARLRSQIRSEVTNDRGEFCPNRAAKLAASQTPVSQVTGGIQKDSELGQ